MKQLPTYKLMIPGPAELDETVLQATAQQTAAHYGTAWVDLHRETSSLLRDVFLTTGDIFLLFCSGSGGVEAALNTLFAPDERVLVVDNGFFGQRLCAIAQSLGLDVVTVSAPLGQAISPEAVRDQLAQDSQIRGLVAVHHETSAGVLNPLAELGAAAQAHGVLFLVDAISSLGGEPLKMDEWGIDVCVTAANKCLGAPVGLSAVAVQPRIWEMLADRLKHAAGWYLNLAVWKQYADEWGDWHPHPVTMSSQSLSGLNVAVKQLLAQGVENRWAAYRETARQFRAEMAQRGFSFFVDEPIASSVITAVNRLPDMDVEDFVTFLINEFGIQIANGIGKTKGEVFRVGHMGPAGSPEYIAQFLQALDAYRKA
ncbi:MAG: alanine--glyoxylate aminotransferase family protein [Chloroflexi bacterium]|nr:alanine--glyoxylate aminotransferase family protein [Chloroflexota bacterium]